MSQAARPAANTIGIKFRTKFIPLLALSLKVADRCLAWSAIERKREVFPPSPSASSDVPWTPSGRHGSHSRRGVLCAAKGLTDAPPKAVGTYSGPRSIVATEPLERRRYRGYDCSSSTVVDPLAANQSRRHAKVNIATSAPQRSPSLLYRGSNREPTKPPAKALADNPKTHSSHDTPLYAAFASSAAHASARRPRPTQPYSSA